MSKIVPIPPLLRYLAARLAQIVPLAFLVIILNFVLLHLAPGDMADVMAGEAGAATPEFMAALRRQFGADEPAPLQLLHYVKRILSLDLGYSFRNGETVLQLILARLPATLLLVGSSLALATLVGMALGWLAAAKQGRWPDLGLSVLTIAGFATPVFWIGLMMIVVFSIHLRWLPTGGFDDEDADLTGIAHGLDVLRHMVMPVTSLAIFYVAIYARLTRTAVLEVATLDFVRMARAKGLTRGRIARAHVLRNALLPLVTITGLHLGALLGGSIVVETVFAWPGLGRLAFDAVAQRDTNLLLGILLCSSLLVMAVNLATDLVGAALDPRIVLR